MPWVLGLLVAIAGASILVGVPVWLGNRSKKRLLATIAQRPCPKCGALLEHVAGLCSPRVDPVPGTSVRPTWSLICPRCKASVLAVQSPQGDLELTSP